MKKKFQKICLTYYNLFIAQNLWQAHYQILSIIFLNESIRSNVNTDMMIKNVKPVEFHTKYVTVFLNTKTFSRMQMFMMWQKLSTKV